jgi:hypothetical protein
MDSELMLSKDYYALAIEIYKCLTLSREHRSEEPKSYLDNKYSQYISLTEASALLSKKMKTDLLATVPDNYENVSIKSNTSTGHLSQSPFDML